MHYKHFRHILVCLLALMALPLSGQVSLGVNAGVTRMKLSGDPPEGLGYFVPRPGFSSSLLFDYRFNDAFSLRIQPGISIQKTKYVFLNDSGTSVLDSIYLTYSSLSVPMHAVVWSEKGRFYVLAGLEFAYTLDFKGELA